MARGVRQNVRSVEFLLQVHDLNDPCLISLYLTMYSWYKKHFLLPTAHTCRGGGRRNTGPARSRACRDKTHGDHESNLLHGHRVFTPLVRITGII